MPIGAGGWFELVSCPHYLGEIVLYCGLVLFVEPTLNSCLLLLWVVRCLSWLWGRGR